mmetsp:Transcript_23523/g.65436  ORF Transcript_23523/g.65436 Transcript_23523/m.65436 type:complete len:463 (+) Transcript_23523:70-1458(+)
MATVRTPRVAVIGGGIAGTLCSLVLKTRGLAPTLIDQGKHGMGGRLRGGAQFFRALDPRLVGLLQKLEEEGLVAPWKGRFGLLGSAKGGFLPAEVVSRNTAALRKKEQQQQSSDGNNTTSPPPMPPPSDGGDFCRFVDAYSEQHATYTGVPNLTELCPNICRRGGVETISNATYVGATPVSEGGWTIQVKTTTEGAETEGGETVTEEAHFDALVLATHKGDLASQAVQAIVNNELAAARDINDENKQEKTEQSTLVTNRLTEIAQNLQRVSSLPVYSVKMRFPTELSHAVPMDAVSIPGSPIVQFLARQSSQAGIVEDEGYWTAITTAQYASSVLDQYNRDDKNDMASANQQVCQEVSDEVTRLFSQYRADTNDPNDQLQPQHVTAKRWGAAFCQQGLQLQEVSILLGPWRLGICGDFIRDLSSSDYAMPLELAALSGLECGERLAALWRAGDDTAPPQHSR